MGLLATQAKDVDDSYCIRAYNILERMLVWTMNDSGTFAWPMYPARNKAMQHGFIDSHPVDRMLFTCHYTWYPLGKERYNLILTYHWDGEPRSKNFLAMRYSEHNQRCAIKCQKCERANARLYLPRLSDGEWACRVCHGLRNMTRYSVVTPDGIVPLDAIDMGCRTKHKLVCRNERWATVAELTKDLKISHASLTKAAALLGLLTEAPVIYPNGHTAGSISLVSHKDQEDLTRAVRQ